MHPKYQLKQAGLGGVTIGNTVYVDSYEASNIGNGTGNINRYDDGYSEAKNLMVLGYSLSSLKAGSRLILENGKLNTTINFGAQGAILFVKDFGGIGGGVAIVPADLVIYSQKDEQNYTIYIPENKEINGVYLSIDERLTPNPILKLQR